MEFNIAFGCKQQHNSVSSYNKGFSWFSVVSKLIFGGVMCVCLVWYSLDSAKDSKYSLFYLLRLSKNIKRQSINRDGSQPLSLSPSLSCPAVMTIFGGYDIIQRLWQILAVMAIFNNFISKYCHLPVFELKFGCFDISKTWTSETQKLKQEIKTKNITILFS